MKKLLGSKITALIIAVLLVVGMSPTVYAAKIKLEKSSVNLAVGEKATLVVDYSELEELDDAPDIYKARVYADKTEFATVDFALEGSDLNAIEITGVGDGKATVFVRVGRYYSDDITVTVGKGDKSPAQIKKEEAAKKAEEDAIKKDKSVLGSALTEAINKATKKEVAISTTATKDPEIPVSTIKALAAKASQAKKYAIVRVDSHDANGKVQAQLYFDPSCLTTIKSAFKTGISIDTSRQASLGGNYIASVKCAHAGSFGAFSEIAVKVNAPKDASKIAVYNVNSAGKLVKIDEPSCSIDKSGFLHFFSRDGGEIVLMKAA